MSPTFFTRLALRLFARRWWFFSASIVGMALLFGTISYGSAPVAAIAGALSGPLIVIPWALLCACIWFHPERGNLQPRSKIIGKLPNALQVGIRWYAALFLAMFIVVGAVVWPALSLAWR